tara:strand:- start:685 stop:858 length:174 start_codon:yes stop_codon:yes gene_type:complete
MTETKQNITANLILGTTATASASAAIYFTFAGIAAAGLPCLAVAGLATLGILNWNLS